MTIQFLPELEHRRVLVKAPVVEHQFRHLEKISISSSSFAQRRILTVIMRLAELASGSTNYVQQILFVDAYDSFSENVGAMLQQTLKATVVYIKIDTDLRTGAGPHSESPAQLSSADKNSFKALLNRFDAIVIGPGPGNPRNPGDIGIVPLVWNLAEELSKPVLGICLGFQSLCHTYGHEVSRLPSPCHGHARTIHHANADIFKDVGILTATLYNSLGVRRVVRPNSSEASHSSEKFWDGFEPLSSRFRGLEALAWDDDGWLMAARHSSLPFWGLQFHPESCKSSAVECRRLIEQWWHAAQPHNKFGRRRESEDNGGPGHYSSAILPQVLTRTNTGRTIDPLISLMGQMLTNAATRSAGQSDRLLEYMNELSVTTSSVLKTSQVPLSCSSEQITQYCYTQPGHCVAMLESTKKGRYSIYAMQSPNLWRLDSSSKCITFTSGESTQRSLMVKCLDIFEVLTDFIQSHEVDRGDPDIPFWGGFVGYFSYEMGLGGVGVKATKSSRRSFIPESSLIWVERSIVVDHHENRAYVQSIRQNDDEWIRETAAQLIDLSMSSDFDLPEDLIFRHALELAEIGLPDEEVYKACITDCQEQLRAGNSYELCLTTEAQVDFASNQTFQLYKNLKHCNPVPFAAYLQLGPMKVLSSSPEQFLKWDRNGSIDMVPMKGTVAKSPEMTFTKASEILASPKESAENLMIADLIRHDLYHALGSEASVEVVKLCEVIEFETVYQLVSHIRANPPPDFNEHPADIKRLHVLSRGITALKHSLPPGSMTGAPKKRSCEILRDLEQRARGIYSGVLGFLDVGGGGSFSVCIRTAFSNDNEIVSGNQKWRVGAGGAITVLSNPEDEWKEMKTKLDSVLRAFRLAEA